jgi:hypothetical protein
MRKHRSGMNVVIDKLTNSIEEVASGRELKTLVVDLSIKGTLPIRKRDWRFNWLAEMSTGHSVLGLVTIEAPDELQGLMSMEDRQDHIFLHLIESAGSNQGKGKVYLGVPGNLVAFACRRSLEAGYDGVVSFEAKTRLIAHYENTLSARRFTGNRMTIDPPQALDLITRYFGTP